jgi:hypothetical protein
MSKRTDSRTEAKEPSAPAVGNGWIRKKLFQLLMISRDNRIWTPRTGSEHPVRSGRLFQSGRRWWLASRGCAVHQLHRRTSGLFNTLTGPALPTWMCLAQMK